MKFTKWYKLFFSILRSILTIQHTADIMPGHAGGGGAVYEVLGFLNRYLFTDLKINRQ